MIKLGDIDLPTDLEWTDEYTWAPVAQDQAIAISGALIIQEHVQSAGRPITLVGGENAAWVTKSVLDEIAAKAALPNQSMTLTYHNAEKTVMFNRKDGAPYEARLVVRIAAPTADDYYSLTLRLIEI